MHHLHRLLPCGPSQPALSRTETGRAVATEYAVTKGWAMARMGQPKVGGGGGGWNSADGFYSSGRRPGVSSNTETWYPDSAGRLSGIENWHTDDEGYWRDENNYYIISSNDYAYGTVVMTSKGEGIVRDDGTVNGNIDMYVNWEI